MAIAYYRRPFIWHSRSAAHGPRRATVWVEELESRQVLATPGPLAGNSLMLVQLPKVGATTPALVAPITKSVTTPSTTPTNLTSGTAPFIVVNGQPPTSPSTSPATPATLPQTPGAGTPINPAPPTNLGVPLPPILQGATVVPPSGPLTFADLQTITANFIGGGHGLTAPVDGRSFNPPSTPRTMPSTTPFQPPLADAAPTSTEELPAGPLQTTEAMIPMIAGFEEGSQLIADQTEEGLRRTDSSVGLRVEASAAPVMVAALAAHWADRHRRPDDDEENAEDGKVRVLLPA